MKKEYHFTITRTDRIYLVVLVMALLTWELVKYVLPHPAYEGMEDMYPLRKTAIMSDSTGRVYDANDKAHAIAQNDEPSVTTRDEEIVHPVLITGALETQLIQIGFKPWVARNVIRYQTAGGKIEDMRDLMKIYGMDSVQLKKVMPFILFPDKTDRIKTAGAGRPEITAWLDLNAATMEQLDSLPGIGIILAERIIKFREALGGFYSTDQLSECYGLPPETLEKIKPHLNLTTAPSHIDINSADLHALSHPYLNRKIARILMAYRQQHGPFTSLDDLRKVYPPDSSWYEPVLPYIRFD